MTKSKHHRVLIIGGGTAGISVASHLMKVDAKMDITLIEPSEMHYYQPGWTFVGAGIFKKEKTARSMKSIMPDGVNWIQDKVTTFDPDQNIVSTENNGDVGYDFMIVAAGIQIDWDSIPGLKESLGKDGVVSNYDYETSQKTWETIKAFKGGEALFTQPKPPFKCPGAAQKIMYLADSAMRKRKTRSKTNIRFFAGAPGIFPIKRYADPLNAVIKRKNIETNYGCHLVELKPASKEAVFEVIATGELRTEKYDMIHVTPPQSAPNFLKDSKLVDAGGWIDVDMHTLQSTKYKNVFGLGDCTNSPNSKTAAAVRNQTPVVVSNLCAVILGNPPKSAYDGYASCPLVTDYGKLILAEFDYNMQPKETFPFNQGKERLSMYWLKKYLLPYFYWNVLFRGGNLGE
ncbi:MAG: NAD(P)/FAD-dependent oxidoreductase [Magnetovibrio sp.]|nr:NAD(P)/FAD-dependent oxidoreductase [Magnetovibrio sp.]